MQKTLPAVLTPQEFAQLLQVGIKSARAIMRELPHLNCEQRLNGQYRTLRITREVAEAFLRGELTRLPALPNMSASWLNLAGDTRSPIALSPTENQKRRNKGCTSSSISRPRR